MSASGISFEPSLFVLYGVAALATVGGIFCLYIGYKTFRKGIQQPRGELKAKARFIEISSTGIARGLFIMGLGALILMVALFVVFVGQLP